jgi:hypothetical protein
VVLAEDDTVVGLAEFSFVRYDAAPLRMSLPRKRGFDGYIRDYDPTRQYRLAVLQRDQLRAFLLAVIEPH